MARITMWLILCILHFTLHVSKCAEPMAAMKEVKEHQDEGKEADLAVDGP